MKRMSWLDHRLCIGLTCCSQKPLSVSSVFRNSQNSFCLWHSIWMYSWIPMQCTRDEGFQTHSNCRFESSSQIQRFLTRSKETWEKINLNEGMGSKMHLRASRMETRENVWKIDQWENLISSCSCQSGFYTEILLTHIFPYQKHQTKYELYR